MKITLVLSIFILVVNLLNQKNVMESALFALALAVGMAPELLPAITTISMSAGAKRLLAKKVIVKKLSSIQNLGGVDLLCTDKTGTITTGEIIVAGMVNPFGEESDFVKMLAFWNATFEAGYSNPIDDALKNIDYETTEFPTKIGEVPYDFIRKRLRVAIQTGSEKLLVTKGAFPQVMGICSWVKMGDGSVAQIEAYQPEIERRFEEYGKEGVRVIGICFQNIDSQSISKEDEREMVFAGFILLEDAVKEGLTATIEELKKLGVNLKIITGDNQNVARSVALNIGIKNPVVMTGAALMKISPEALFHRINKTHIFAEVEPHQKERIIQSLRKTHTVAYMGDGINDVSAITAADVGISVENAVDITRAAADFVLTEKDLSVLVEGIKEGRRTFANTLKYIYISTGSTFGNMISVAAASLVLPFLPMLPKQILLTNLISDFPFISVTTDNVDEEQLAKPLKWNLTLIRRYMLVFGIHSSFFDLLTFFTLLFLMKAKESEFQTGWFIVSALSELLILFIIRTHKNFYKSNPGKYLLVLSIAGLIVTISFPYLPFAREVGMVPLPILNLGAMFTIVLCYALTADVLKVWFFKKYRNM